MQPPKILNDDMYIEQVRDLYFMKLIYIVWDLWHNRVKQSQSMTVNNIIPYLKLKTRFNESDIRSEIQRLHNLDLIIIHNSIITKNIGFNGYFNVLAINIKQYNHKSGKR
jgi:hypothetical protein